MRIVIDMQGAQSESRFRGIGRYTLSFAQAVVRNRGKHEIILALSGLFPDTIEPIRAAFDGLLPQENIYVWHAPGPVRGCVTGNNNRRQVAEIIREAFLASLQPDVIHVCSLFEGYGDDAVTSFDKFDFKTITSVTVHDLIPLLNPEKYLSTNSSFKKYYLEKLDYIKNCSVVLAVSASAKKEVATNIEIDDKKIYNTLEAVEPFFKKIKINASDEVNIKNKFNITKSFLLYTGGSDERKNLPRLIQAYSMLPAPLRQTHQLVFAGQINEAHIAQLKKTARSAGLNEDELVFTGYVSDEQLVQLYNLCRLFVFASWHEGFGLPLLEAMACGAPVIAANTSSVPEVIGLAEALFDPFDVNSINSKLTQALKDEKFHKRLQKHGLGQVKIFSWDKTAIKAIKAWQRVTSSKQEKYKVQASKEYSFDKFLNSIAPYLKTLDDSALSFLALHIAQNKTASLERQLLVDISGFIQHDSKSVIQRVVRNILKEWLENPPKGYRVEPVYASTTEPYRYARLFVAKFIDNHNDLLADEPIEFSSGDIFFGLDMQTHAQIAKADFFQFIRQQGIIVKFLVHDLLPILQPQYFLPDSTENFTKWLQVVAESDGAICVSKTVGNELREWMDNKKWKRLRRFDITFLKSDRRAGILKIEQILPKRHS